MYIILEQKITKQQQKLDLSFTAMLFHMSILLTRKIRLIFWLSYHSGLLFLAAVLCSDMNFGNGR